MNRYIVFAASALMAIGCSEAPKASYDVIPKPQQTELQEGNPFVITKSTVIYADASLSAEASFLSDYIAESTGYKLKTAEGTPAEGKPSIVLTLTGKNDASENPDESYVLTVTSNQTSIAGPTSDGIFHGMQTLRKSLPVNAKGKKVELPAVTINDYPRFSYRGMHLDVCRHFFPVDFVKSYIDILALHNINIFHWHLSEDQGWRFVVDKYPKLTEIGAWRDSTVRGRINSGVFDVERYGGFYTKDELREVVAYAKARHIDIIPEVDMPGHMSAALASYPELGCTGGPYKVESDWGIFKDVLCMGNDDTKQFLKDVFDEITDIFPYKYVHIGGDEIPRDRWKECPKCQARIKQLGLKPHGKFTAEDLLQSWCTTEIEKFLQTKGREIIGWDEIVDGDISHDAIVMSGNRLSGGIRAAQRGNRVVMAPNAYYYFDYYQTDDVDNEPLAIGGYLPVSKVYNSEPTDGLTPDQAKFVIGVQANLWTEYITTAEYAQYMVLPRMDALCEVQWTEPELKDYDDFSHRLVKMFQIYDREGWNYARHLYDITAKYAADTAKRVMTATLSTLDDAPIYYTLDGSEPTKSSAKYEGPVEIKGDADFVAVTMRPGEDKVHRVSQSFRFNKATLKPIRFVDCKPYDIYTFGGAPTLVDGIRGTSNWKVGTWIGFHGTDDIQVVIDLEQPTEIHHVAIGACVDQRSWLMGPVSMAAFASEDGESFERLAGKDWPLETEVYKSKVEDYAVDFEPVTTRYVMVVVSPSPAFPKGHAAEGHKPYLFVDEIVVE